jgi:AcrR family transcriptional regulator
MRVKTEDRRQAIMHAAVKVFGEVGYERASMNEIAARVGFSKATIYSYFPSKEDLFATALIETHSEEAQAFHDVLDLSRKDERAVLEEFGRLFLRFNCSPELLDNKRNALAQGAASPLGPLLFERGPMRTVDTVKAYLQGLMERGVLRSSDAEMAAWHFLGVLGAGIVDARLFGAEARIGVERAAALAVEVFMRAYEPVRSPVAG